MILDHVSKGANWREALFKSFVQVDDRFAEIENTTPTHAGCTACCMAFDGVDNLFMANLGDCRIVMCQVRRTGKAY